jgi:hypothetical protein
MVGALLLGIAMAVLLVTMESNEQQTATSEAYTCGDANGDGQVNVLDLTKLATYLFRSGTAPVPLASGDMNNDGVVNVSDVNYLSAYLWKAGPAPVCSSSQTYASCSDVPATVLSGRTCRPTTCAQSLVEADSYYLLTQDVTAAKTACVIKGDRITLDLNGHTVTYGNSPAIAFNNGFENGNGSNPTGWDIATAPNVTRYQGTLVKPVSVFTGNYSLRFDLPASPQSVRTSSPVSFSGNTTYALTAMVHNTVSDDITVAVELDGTSYRASQTGITWRGFQLINVLFRPTSNVSAPVKVSISGSGMSTDGNIYVDDVMIQPAQYYGIAIPTYDNGRVPDIDLNALPSGNPDNLKITNGTIVQGTGNPFSGHGIYFVEGVSDVEISNLTSVIQGPESSNIFAEWSHSNAIHDNTLVSNVRALVSRDNFSAAMLNLSRTRGGNLIYNNTFSNGPHSGLYMGDFDGTSVGGSQIYNNTFKMKARYTNGFAIAGGDRNGLIHNNTILNVDGYYGRGIHGGNGAHFYDNYIEVSDVAYNQEYDGCQPPGVYGFQVEEGEGTRVTNNTIIARTGTGLCNAMGLRFTSPLNNILINGNTVTAVDNDRTDAYRAYGASFSRGDNDAGDLSGVQISNNTFTSNSSWMNFGSVQHTRLLNNVFSLDTSLAADVGDFVPLTGSDGSLDTLYRNASFGSEQAASLFRASDIVWNGQVDTAADFAMQYEYAPTVTTTAGQRVAGAAVTISYAGTEVYSGTTGSDGKLTTPAWLNDFRNSGGNVTEYASYAIRMQKSGYAVYNGTFAPKSSYYGFVTLSTP